MLKLYVECTSRFYSLKNSAKKHTDEDGFVSAETIALAVAGVVIVGALLGIFRSQLQSAVDSLFGDIGGLGGSSSD